MEQQPTCDAIVSFADALEWVEPLIKAKRDVVIDQALAVEPAVLGVAADLARRTCERLEKYRVCEELCEYVYHQIMLTGAMSIELMRKPRCPVTPPARRENAARAALSSMFQNSRRTACSAEC